MPLEHRIEKKLKELKKRWIEGGFGRYKVPLHRKGNTKVYCWHETEITAHIEVMYYETVIFSYQEIDRTYRSRKTHYHDVDSDRRYSIEIRLRHGGFNTHSTKNRINQCLNSFSHLVNLPITVFQENFDWYLALDYTKEDRVLFDSVDCILPLDRLVVLYSGEKIKY